MLQCWPYRTGSGPFSPKSSCLIEGVGHAVNRGTPVPPRGPRPAWPRWSTRTPPRSSRAPGSLSPPCSVTWSGSRVRPSPTVGRRARHAGCRAAARGRGRGTPATLLRRSACRARPAADYGDIRWLLFWPVAPEGNPYWSDATEAAEVLIAACLRQLEEWGVTSQDADGDLPVRGVYGVPAAVAARPCPVPAGRVRARRIDRGGVPGSGGRPAAAGRPRRWPGWRPGGRSG